MLAGNFGIDFSYQLAPQLSDPQLDCSPEAVADINHAYDNLSSATGTGDGVFAGKDKGVQQIRLISLYRWYA